MAVIMPSIYVTCSKHRLNQFIMRGAYSAITCNHKAYISRFNVFEITRINIIKKFPKQ